MGAHRYIKPDNIFLKKEGSEVPRLVLGDWGCYTDRMTGKNVDVANGDLRRGNRAYMPPEILSAARGKVLDYRRADAWSISLIALDILAKGLGNGNPFYPVRGRSRILEQDDYTDDDVDWFLWDRKNLFRDVPAAILGSIKSLVRRDPEQRAPMRDVCNQIFFHCFDLPQRTLSAMSNLERLDNWLVQIYSGIRSDVTTIDHIKICFLSNLTLEAFSSYFSRR